MLPILIKLYQLSDRVTDRQTSSKWDVRLQYLPGPWPVVPAGQVVGGSAVPHKGHSSSWCCPQRPAGHGLAHRIAIATGPPARPAAAPPGARRRHSSGPGVTGQRSGDIQAYKGWLMIRNVWKLWNIMCYFKYLLLQSNWPMAQPQTFTPMYQASSRQHTLYWGLSAA